MNLLSSLFNTYLGTDYPMWPDERYPAEWFGGPEGVIPLTSRSVALARRG